MSPGFIVLCLSLLLGIQPITTDLYLPALPAITSGFAAPLSQAQLTLSGLLLAFGLSQMAWGPLSDRIGRRPVLLWGLMLYTLGGVGCAFAASMEGLIVCRIAQGAAMGAVVMAGRAIVRDLYVPEAGARVMTKALGGLGVLAALSGPVGSWVASAWGWRASMGVVAAFGALSWLLLWFRFDETLGRFNPQALQPRMLWGTWRSILRHPTFWAYSLLATVSYAGLFTFLGASSFVFIEVLGLSRVDYGWVMFTMAVAYLSGTMLCRRLLPKFGVQRTVALGGFITLTGAGVLALLPYWGVISALGILLPFCVFMIGHGIHQPCGQSGCVGPFPQAAGAASALNGLFMMVAAFGMGHWLGQHLDGTVFPLTNGVAFWGVCICVTAWTLVQRHGGQGPR
ncbi:MAG: hypothetical protein RLZZ612_2260 [Pseudomonadota bacterium]